jgi:hypothetical protein
MDYDKGVIEDEQIGCFSLNLKDIRNGIYTLPTWKTLYGPHINTTPAVTESKVLYFIKSLPPCNLSTPLIIKSCSNKVQAS